jgi:hypothetical protein
MSGMNASVEKEERQEGMETLSTGMENLDFAIEHEGIRTGSLVALLADPNSPGDIVAANMVANRPAYYYTLGRSEEHVERNIKNIPNVSLDTTHISTVDSDNPVETLRGVLENTELPRAATVIIDPVNVIESLDFDAFKQLVHELQAKIEKKDGVGILYGINPEAESENRWFTMAACDTVFEVIHEQRGESVEDYLTVQKLYPGQELVNNDTRKFQLDRSLDIDITTSRNISP